MKLIQYCIFLLFCLNNSIIANINFKFESLIFERISYDKGNTWEPALCKHIKLGKRGIDCIENLPEPTRIHTRGEKENYRTELHSRHRITVSFISESGDTVTEILYYSGNIVKHNGRIIAVMEEGITSISLFTPDMNTYIVIHAGEAEDTHPFSEINEIAKANAQKIDILPELTAFPNPLTQNNLNLHSNIRINKIAIYDSTGRLVMTDDEVWDTRRNISLEGFAPGIYLIDCYSESNFISPIARLKILKN